MLEMFERSFSSGEHSKEAQRQAETLEKALSNRDPRDLQHWVNKHARKLDQRLVATLVVVSTHLLRQTTITSTQQLLRLDLLMDELFQHASGKSWSMELLLIQKALEEDGVGPRSVSAKDAGGVYKRVYNYRGCCLAEHGQYTASIEHFNATLAIDPHFAPAYCNRARAYVELNRLEEAWADCETLHSFDPDYLEGRATRQLVEMLRRLRESREGSLAKIAEEHGLLELLRRYDRPLKPGEYAASLGGQINLLERAELSDSDATPEDFNHLGVVQGRSGDYAGAIESFNRALQLNPEYLEPYYNRGRVYLMASAYEKAIADFSFLLERNPQDTEVYELRKQAYERRKRELRSSDTSRDTASVSSEGQQLDEGNQNEKDIDDRQKRVVLLSPSSPQQAHELPDELDDLAYVGPSAPVRPQVIAAARNLLYPEGLDIPDTPTDASAEALYRQATMLRNSNKYHEAMQLYRSALAHYTKLNQQKNMSACLNGLGISYQELTREVLKREFTAHKETLLPLLDGAWTTYCYQAYQLVYRHACDFAEKGRACHRWSLELHKQMDSLAGQANQISGLGMIEELMKNLDTARRYHLWALHTHQKAGKLADVAIDLIHLAQVDRSLGDEGAAVAWERQLQEVRRGAQF